MWIDVLKKVSACFVAVTLIISLVPVPPVKASVIKLEGPRIDNGEVIYDTVEFGSYPQAEVVESTDDQTTIAEVIRNGEDYIVDATLYEALQSATWTNNETKLFC